MSPFEPEDTARRSPHQPSPHQLRAHPPSLSTVPLRRPSKLLPLAELLPPVPLPPTPLPFADPGAASPPRPNPDPAAAAPDDGVDGRAARSMSVSRVHSARATGSRHSHTLRRESLAMAASLRPRPAGEKARSRTVPRGSVRVATSLSRPWPAGTWTAWGETCLAEASV